MAVAAKYSPAAVRRSETCSSWTPPPRTDIRHSWPVGGRQVLTRRKASRNPVLQHEAFRARLGVSRWRDWKIFANGQDTTGSHHIAFSGGGIYFFWQLGVAKYLLQNYDLSNVEMSGTSCGALCATLTACAVDPDEIVQSAYELSLENDLWSRPLGLAGIWGRLILEWLEELLPEDSGEMCRDRVQIMVTELPSFQQSAVNDFASKEDLIAVNMASIHVPVFLDWRVTRPCRGKQCVDGSIPNVVFRKEMAGPDAEGSGRCIIVDHNMDERLKVESFGFLKLQEYEEVLHMMDLGYTFAKELDLKGGYEGLPASLAAEEAAPGDNSLGCAVGQ